jgi:hypothetical protein
MISSCLEASPVEVGATIEFDATDIAQCVALWRATAGNVPPLAMHLESETGVVAMFAPIRSWDDLGTSRDFDLVYPPRAAAFALLNVVAPWRTLPISDFLSHVYDASRTASPDEVIRVAIECIQAIAMSPSRRLRAKAVAPRG